MGAAVGGCGDGLDGTEVVSGAVGLERTGEDVGCGDAVEVSVTAAVISAGIASDCFGTADGVQADKVTAREHTTRILISELRFVIKYMELLYTFSVEAGGLERLCAGAVI